MFLTTFYTSAHALKIVSMLLRPKTYRFCSVLFHSSNFNSFQFARLFAKLIRPAGVSKVIFAVFESSCHLFYRSNHSNNEAILLSALSKDTTSELASLSSNYPFLMLNDKQKSSEHKLLKFFGPTQTGNRTQAYRLWGGRSNHEAQDARYILENYFYLYVSKRMRLMESS